MSESRSIRTRITCSLLACILAAAGLVPLATHLVSAQETGQIDDSTYRFALDGTEIHWQGDWEFDPSGSFADVGYETASLISPLAGLFVGEIASPVPVDLDALLAIVLDSLAQDADQFVTVERSATDIVSYSLDAAVVEGVATALFTYVQFNGQAGIITYTSIFSDYVTFAANIADAQSNITINGRIALEGIDGSTLQGLLPPLEGGSQTSSGGRPGTDDEDDADDADDTDKDKPQFGGNDDDADEQDDDNTGGSDDERDENDIDPDLADLGIVDDGLYESPQFGTEIEWSGDWELDEELLSSDEDNEVDGFGLALANSGGIIISIAPAGDITPADFAAYWESDDFLDENASPDAEVLLSDSTRSESGVLISDVVDDGTELWVLRQAYSLDGGDTIATVLIVALPDNFPDLLAAAQDDITIDGDPALTLFSIDDVEDAA